MKLVVATTNLHKLEEILSVAKADLGFTFLSLQDFPEAPSVVEDGSSFEENAFKKAKTISEYSGLDVIADDSGLCVPALSGRPGIYSARYAGVGSTDAQNNQKLLMEMRSLHGDARNAFYVCSIVLYRSNGTYLSGHGELHGTILTEPRGNFGFGYDPIFFLPEKNKTLAEIPRLEKIIFSHRTRALQSVLKQLKSTSMDPR